MDTHRLPPLSRRQLDLLFLLVDNCPMDSSEIPPIIRYEFFYTISPAFIKNHHNLTAAIHGLAPILKLYGFYVVPHARNGYACHRSLIHSPSAFDKKFHGAKKIKIER